MAPPRSTETKIPRVVRQATAAPVDTFVKPEVSQLEQLAQALGEVQPRLMKYSQEFLDRYNSESQQKGIALAQKLAEEGKAAGAMTREGDLAMQDNAWFRAGLEEEQGRILAGKWRSDFIGSEEFAAIKGSTDLADFDKAAQAFNSKFSKGAAGGSEFFQRGYGTLQNNYQAAARYEFATGIEGKLGAQSDMTLRARTIQIVNDDSRAGVDPGVTAAAINKLVEQYEARGRNQKFTRTAVADALKDAALNADRPEDGLKLLILWDGVRGEEGVSLKDSAFGSDEYFKLRETLTSKFWERESRDLEQLNRARKLTVETAMREYAEVLDKDSTNSGQQILDKPEYADVRAQLVEGFANLGRQNDARVFKDNEWTIRNTYNRILNPDLGGPKVDSIYISRLNLSAEKKIMLMNQLEEINKAKASGSYDRVYKDPMINEERELARLYFQDPINGIIPPEKADKLGGLKAAFDVRVIRAIETGEFDAVPDAQKRAWLRGVMSELGRTDKGLKGTAKVNPVLQYPLDPNQPELGPVPSGGPAAPLKPPQKDAGTPSNPFTELPLRIDRTVLRAATTDGDPGQEKAIEAVINDLIKAGIPPTTENITLYISAQMAAAAADGGTTQ